MTTNNKKPLDGIKVLDLTRVLAGPYCGMVLQDLGAEVIKIENPKTGDDSRCFGPFKNGKSLYFTAINCGKKSLSLSLRAEVLPVYRPGRGVAVSGAGAIEKNTWQPHSRRARSQLLSRGSNM